MGNEEDKSEIEVGVNLIKRLRVKFIGRLTGIKVRIRLIVNQINGLTISLIKRLRASFTKNRKKIIIGIIISIFTLFFIYFGMAMYFMNHFYFGSAINCISVSGEAVEDVNEEMAADLQTYKLIIKQTGVENEQITSKEIGLSYNSDGQIEKLKDSQNPYKWISSVFNDEDSKMTKVVKYDENLLKKRLGELSCFDSSNIIEPENPSFKYTDSGYAIVSEVRGNKVDSDILYDKVSDAIIKQQSIIDLGSLDCYVKPLYTTKSQKVIDTKNILNKYVFSKITYEFGQHKELLDGATINKWLSVDINFEVTFNEKEANNYIDSLSKSYNTVGKTRAFTSSVGKTIKIGGGDYGWTINKEKETKALITTIKEGETISKQPLYIQTALSHGNNDIGNTYVEIDMTNQHLWFYKNGSLVVQGDVVTGNIGANTGTPGGIYSLKYKEKNAVLKGQGYASPVSFWMPFNAGIGIHDANWRSTFGGEIYKSSGSHGCINSPYYLAKAVFNNIEAGTPVVCY